MERWSFILALAACSGQRTEVVVLVAADPLLRVPDEVDSIRFTVVDTAQNRTLQFTNLVCPSAATCVPFPVTLTLYPGPGNHDDAIQARVEALHGTTAVITNGAVFRFSPGQSELLELALWRVCLNGPPCNPYQSCGEDGTCHTAVPHPFAGELDFTLPPDGSVTDASADSSGASELSTGPDDLACGAACQDLAYADSSSTCGARNQPCCAGPMCGPFLMCGMGVCRCGAIGQPCCGGTTCTGSMCYLGSYPFCGPYRMGPDGGMCGGSGQRCCQSGQPCTCSGCLCRPGGFCG